MFRFCRGLGVLLIASGVLAAAGCGTLLPVAALDDAERAELASLRAALGDRTILVVNPPSDERVSRALRESGFKVSSAQASDPANGLRVEFVGTSGGPLSDPWSTIFGVFVIPVWTDAHAYRLRLSDGAREIPCECPVGVPMVYGWLAQPLRLLPRWRGWVVYIPPEDRDAVDQRIALTIAQRLVAISPSE